MQQRLKEKCNTISPPPLDVSFNSFIKILQYKKHLKVLIQLTHSPKSTKVTVSLCLSKDVVYAVLPTFLAELVNRLSEKKKNFFDRTKDLKRVKNSESF